MFLITVLNKIHLLSLSGFPYNTVDHGLTINIYIYILALETCDPSIRHGQEMSLGPVELSAPGRTGGFKAISWFTIISRQ